MHTPKSSREVFICQQGFGYRIPQFAWPSWLRDLAVVVQASNLSELCTRLVLGIFITACFKNRMEYCIECMVECRSRLPNECEENTHCGQFFYIQIRCSERSQPNILNQTHPFILKCTNHTPIPQKLPGSGLWSIQGRKQNVLKKKANRQKQSYIQTNYLDEK